MHLIAIVPTSLCSLYQGQTNGGSMPQLFCTSSTRTMCRMRCSSTVAWQIGSNPMKCQLVTFQEPRCGSGPGPGTFLGPLHPPGRRAACHPRPAVKAPVPLPVHLPRRLASGGPFSWVPSALAFEPQGGSTTKYRPDKIVAGVHVRNAGLKLRGLKLRCSRGDACMT